MKKIFLLLSLAIVGFSYAQNQTLSIDDAILKGRTTLAPERLSQMMWKPDNKTISYVGKKNGKEVLIYINTPGLTRDTVLTIEDFYSSFYSIMPEEKKLERFPFFSWLDNNTMLYNYNNTMYVYNLSSKKTSLKVKMPGTAENLDYEKINNRIAYTVGNSLYVSDITSKDVLTDYQKRGKKEGIVQTDLVSGQDGGFGLVVGKTVHRSEFGISKGTFWSPKGNKLAYYKMNESMVTNYGLMQFESKPSGIENIKYPMAGAKSHEVKLYFYDFTKKRNIEVETGGPAEQYLTNIAWSPNEDYLYIAVVNRAQNEMKMNMYDGLTGKFIKTIFIETHDKYVEPEKPVLFVKNNEKQFIWQSERNGFNNLYLYERGGKLLKQLTNLKQHISEVLSFDATGNNLYFMAFSADGMNKYLYSVEIKTSKVTQHTKIEGIHTPLVSDDGVYIVDNFSNLTTPRQIILSDNKGRLYGSIVNAINPIINYQSTEISLGKIKSTDGSTDLNYRLIKPANFDATKKYPCIVYVYGGPHAQMVTNSWLGQAELWMLAFAQQGYVIFTVDNRGSLNRGLTFENVTHRQLGKIEIADQLAGVSFLKQQSFIDSTKLGVYGWSFGGFMTTSLMTRTPDVFKVGVAGGAVIDWSMYEIMYTERYMDTPEENPEGYKENNLLNYTKNLKGRLLLIHGTNDDVVLWNHTLNYVKKSVDEGVLVDYAVYPTHAHNVLGPDRVHLFKKINQYFNDFLK
ncbi:MAG: DPP IV N-terminal domain-containing protein [Bacteroidota bacterium]